MTGTDLVPVEGELVHTSTLFGTDDPAESLMIAKAHADVLADVIKERNLFTVIGGKAHVFVDAWTLLGSRLGVFPVLDGEVEPVEVEGVAGFRATVKVVTRHGEIVGRATAYCMRDEPTWKNRPIHTLAGMAETRATSRALRKPLGFIVQLAGYSPTAAEEMPRVSAGAVSLPPHDPAAAPAENDVPFLEPGETATRLSKKTWDDFPEETKTKTLQRLTILVKKTKQPPLRNVYHTVGLLRSRSTDNMILDVGGLGEDGELHWSPLRDSLTWAEASYLIDRLEKLGPQT